MNTRAKPFTLLAAAIFALIAVIHIVRLFTHFQVVVGSHQVPDWVSYVAIVVAALFSWMLCREARGAAPDQP